MSKKDSFFVENISVDATRKYWSFHPQVYKYTMAHYMKDSNGNLYPNEYSANKFSLLPKENRLTYTNQFVYYTIHFKSNRNIDFESFSVDIFVDLVGKNGKKIKMNHIFEFEGEQECYFTVH
jgi:hypothetical protein